MQKILTTLAFLLLLGASPVMAQSVQDSVASDTAGRRGGRIFIDEDGDGIADKAQGKGLRKQHGKDRFIDMDGDGICDSRASGLGFRRGQEKSGQPGAPKQQGNRRGGKQ